MKRKLRDRLISIEHVIKELTKKVHAIDLTQLSISNRDDDHKDKGKAILRDTQKAIVKRVFRKARKRTKR